MNKGLGFKIIPNVFTELQLGDLRDAMECVVKQAGTVCVRNLLDRSAVVNELANSAMLLRLLPQNYLPVRAIFFDKTEESNWPVAWHQDLTIAVKEKVEVVGYGPWSNKMGVVHVQPPAEVLENMQTLRIHLDETSSSNGALQVIEGSHQLGKLKQSALSELEKSEWFDCECEAGDVLMMSPLLVHASQRSVHPSRRRIIHIEYAKSDVLDNRLQWAEGRG